jgi:tRNA-modifying protein YgfZ
MFSPEQYRAVREAAGIVDRSNRGKLLLTGKDRRDYLQGLLTNDIAALESGSGCYAALLTPQGRMIADMRVLELGDAVSVDLEPRVTATVRDRFDQFIFSEDVRVGDVTEQRALIGVYGPQAAEVVSRAWETVGAGNSLSPARLEAMTVHANVRRESEGREVVLVRSDEIGVSGYDLFVERSDAEGIRGALQAAGALEIDPDVAEISRVESGRPLFGADMDEDTIPLEAGIEDRAISLTKGCYVGQEIIIRVLHRGHGRVARRLIGLTLENSDCVPAHGDRIRSGDREIGRVTSAVASPALGRAIALGYVHRDFAEPGTTMVLIRDDRALPAVVTKLPFVEPSAMSEVRTQNPEVRS